MGCHQHKYLQYLHLERYQGTIKVEENGDDSNPPWLCRFYGDVMPKGVKTSSRVGGVSELISLAGCSNKVARIEEVEVGDASNPTWISKLVVVVLWFIVAQTVVLYKCASCLIQVSSLVIMFKSASTSIAERESTMINSGELVFSSSSRCWIRLNATTSSWVDRMDWKDIWDRIESTVLESLQPAASWTSREASNGIECPAELAR